MKIFFILVLFLVQSFSLFAGMGARFRNTVYKMNLTQPAVDQLQAFESKKFRHLKNAYRYLPELAVYPKYDQTDFGKTQTQQDLMKEYGEILKKAPEELKLSCRGRCSYNHDESDFSYVIKTRNKRADCSLNFSITRKGQLKAYTETEDGMIVLRLLDDTIEVYENFNRSIFSTLSLAQLVILAHVYAISECVQGERYAFIHSDWYKIYTTIPQEVFTFMFNNKIKVVQLD